MINVATSDIAAPPGGVMTDEVGVITGELTLRTSVEGTVARLSVQYRGADEWYAVSGATVTLRDPVDAQALHSLAVALLDRPD